MELGCESLTKYLGVHILGVDSTLSLNLNTPIRNPHTSPYDTKSSTREHITDGLDRTGIIWAGSFQSEKVMCGDHDEGKGCGEMGSRIVSIFYSCISRWLSVTLAFNLCKL